MQTYSFGASASLSQNTCTAKTCVVKRLFIGALKKEKQKDNQYKLKAMHGQEERALRGEWVKIN